MDEDPRNIFVTCSEHSSRPQEKYALMNASFFRDKWVKVAFLERNTNKPEHLWVRVTKIKDNKTLLGLIDNDPVLKLGLKCGDPVEVGLHEIEDICD